jgi:hypothetical protein
MTSIELLNGGPTMEASRNRIFIALILILWIPSSVCGYQNFCRANREREERLCTFMCVYVCISTCIAKKGIYIYISKAAPPARLARGAGGVRALVVSQLCLVVSQLCTALIASGMFF